MRPSEIASDILIADSLSPDVLSGSLLCLNGMRLLEYAREQGGIGLTKSGGFVRTCVNWAAGTFERPRFTMADLMSANRVLNEPDFPPLAILHDLMLGSKLMRHYAGKAVLTKSGAKIIGDHGKLQALMFDTYFAKLNLADYERFPIDGFQFDYSRALWVINNLGDQRIELGKLADLCLPVDLIVSPVLTPLHEACFFMMSNVVRPLNWFGLIDVSADSRQTPIASRSLQRTKLFAAFLKFVSLTPYSHRPH